PQRRFVLFEQRDDPGNGAGGGEHQHVALTHHPALRQLIGNRFERLGRDPDDRPVRHRAYSPSAVSAISWSTTALRSFVRWNVASWRSALEPSARILYAYPTSSRLPSSSTTSPMNHSSSSRTRSRAGSSMPFPKSMSWPSSP